MGGGCGVPEEPASTGQTDYGIIIFNAMDGQETMEYRIGMKRVVACVLVGLAITAIAEEKRVTTAQCVARIVADYEDRLARAKSEGKEKAIPVYTKKIADLKAGVGDLVEDCQVNDSIIAKEKYIADLTKEMSDLTKERSDLTKERSALQKNIANNKATVEETQQTTKHLAEMEAKQYAGKVTKGDIDVLVRHYTNIKKFPDYPKKKKVLELLQRILETYGRRVE